jgi:molecular chaperone DnaK
VAAYYEACLPMIEETLALTEQVLEKSGSPEQGKPPVLYLTGGASELPLVSRMVRERFGRRVHRSAYMRSATAIGLAIHAEGALPAPLRERFTRHFGLWREAQGGDRIVFDPLIRRGAPLPHTGAPPIRLKYAYSPAHNIGHYRFLECTALDEAGTPTGDLTTWDEIRFPFDPRLAGLADLTGIPVERDDVTADQRIEEEYEVSSSGTITVRLRNVTAGYQREFSLGHWAARKSPAPAVRRRHRAKPGM